MKRFVSTGIIMIVTIINLYGQIPDSLKYKSLKPHDFLLLYLKSDSSMLIDVRESFEFTGKRLKGAVNIPSSGKLESATDTINRNRSLFLYCTSGVRSKRIAVRLYDLGFRKLYSLEGGITAWKKERLPVIRGKKAKK